MCDCIDRVDKKLRESFNARLGVSLPLDGSEHRVIVATMPLRVMRDGRARLSLEATFCPFCGVQYQAAASDTPDPDPHLARIAAPGGFPPSEVIGGL